MKRSENMSVRPTAATLLLSENCNLKCEYCFEQHKPFAMTKEVARKSIDFLSDGAIINKTGNFSITLFGGEPMLEPDIMEELFRYGYEVALKKKLNFSASIITNATLLDEKRYNIIKEWKDKVNLEIQLSVDGKAETQNTYRITKDGKPSFHLVEKNVPRFKELFKDAPRRLSVHGVISKKTLDKLYENYLFFHQEWGMQRIWFIPVIEEEWTEDDVKIYDEQMSKITDYILSIVKRDNSIEEIYNYAPLDRCLRQSRGFPSAPCGAGKNFVTITAKGYIYPCHQIYFNDKNNETYIGSIFTGIYEPNRKLFLDYDSSDLTCPKDCDHYYCYRCIAVNWIKTGSILIQPEGLYCKMQKVDQKYQKKIEKELIKMGLLNQNKNNYQYDYRPGNNPDNPDCLCDCRGGDCDVVTYGPECGANFPSNGNNQGKACSCKPSSSEGSTQVADELAHVLQNLILLQKITESAVQEVQAKVTTLERKIDLIINNIE